MALHLRTVQLFMRLVSMNFDSGFRKVVDGNEMARKYRPF